MYTSQDLAIRIKAIAKERNTVIKDMLAELSLGSNTMSALYHGKSIAFDSLGLIADYLDCSVDYLLGRTDNPNITSETYNNGDNGIQNVKNGTVNINQSDEMTKEISLLLSDLTYRQKTDLMKQIYDFVDETKREGE